MKTNHTQTNLNLCSIQSQARLLVSQKRQEQRHSKQNMLQRAIEAINTDINTEI